MKTFFCAIAVCISVHANCQNINQRLITINNVASVAQMNAISNPEQRSLVYVTSEQLTYQYIGSQWIPFASEDIQTTIDSLTTVVNTFNELQSDSCCGVNIDTYHMPIIGEISSCGILFYIEPGASWGLIASFDELIAPYGCYGTNLSGLGLGDDGESNTSLLVSQSCMQATDAASICDNYTSNGCDDWYLGSHQEMTELFTAMKIVNDSLAIVPGADLIYTSAYPASHPYVYYMNSEVMNYGIWSSSATSKNAGTINPGYPNIDPLMVYSAEIYRNASHKFRPIRKVYF